MVMISGVAAFGLAFALSAQTEPSERLYGRVLTEAGDRVEGYLRWDRNETHWADFLDGRKEIPREFLLEAERLDDELRRQRERERSIALPGVRITWEVDDLAPPELSDTAVRFGYLRSLEVTGERRAMVDLVSGERLELVSGSSDLGRGFRGLIVDDPVRGEVEIEWRELLRVDFMPALPGRATPAAERLRGTVRTRSGLSATGFVAWDLDESLTTDILDGERDSEEIHLAFGDITRVAWESDSSARVTLATGSEMVLDDSNDVDSSNRGIEITDPSLGRLIVDWEELVSLDFERSVLPTDLPRSVADRSTFSGAARLRGSVVARDGRRVTGFIRWDNDEEFTWELLDGRSDDVEFAIELGRVRSIERLDVEAGTADEEVETESRVTLADGRIFTLGGDDDVSEGNRGIFVDPGDGETVLVSWRDFLRADFEP